MQFKTGDLKRYNMAFLYTLPALPSGTAAERKVIDIAEEWLLCPSCGSKARVKLRQDTRLENFQSGFERTKSFHSALVQWASRQPGVLRIEAETDKDNIASQRVLAKSGFVPSGMIDEEGPRFVWVRKRG